jgi:hypothetical protein
VKNDLEAQDSFKKRVFDHQLSMSTAVIDCANEMDLPFFYSIKIPTVNKID